jgi:hypothetical protein
LKSPIELKVMKVMATVILQYHSKDGLKCVVESIIFRTLN